MANMIALSRAHLVILPSQKTSTNTQNHYSETYLCEFLLDLSQRFDK